MMQCIHRSHQRYIKVLIEPLQNVTVILRKIFPTATFYNQEQQRFWKNPGQTLHARFLHLSQEVRNAIVKHCPLGARTETRCDHSMTFGIYVFVRVC